MWGNPLLRLAGSGGDLSVPFFSLCGTGATLGTFAACGAPATLGAFAVCGTAEDGIFFDCADQPPVLWPDGLIFYDTFSRTESPVLPPWEQVEGVDGNVQTAATSGGTVSLIDGNTPNRTTIVATGGTYWGSSMYFQFRVRTSSPANVLFAAWVMYDAATVTGFRIWWDRNLFAPRLQRVVNGVVVDNALIPFTYFPALNGWVFKLDLGMVEQRVKVDEFAELSVTWDGVGDIVAPPVALTWDVLTTPSGGVVYDHVCACSSSKVTITGLLDGEYAQFGSTGMQVPAVDGEAVIDIMDESATWEYPISFVTVRNGLNGAVVGEVNDPSNIWGGDTYEVVRSP